MYHGLTLFLVLQLIILGLSIYKENHMNEITFPTQSTRTLVKASVAAVLIAIVVFITIVLPVEYGIDPSGAGKALGLTVLNNQQSATNQQQNQTEKVTGTQKDQATVIVPANSGVEYKFQMKQYANLTYKWSSDGEAIYFDFHGEPKGDTTGYFESYTIATAAEVEGSMTVPFEGVHGWYWKNTSDKEIVVRLKTEGQYEVVGLLH